VTEAVTFSPFFFPYSERLDVRNAEEHLFFSFLPWPKELTLFFLKRRGHVPSNSSPFPLFLRGDGKEALSFYISLFPSGGGEDGAAALFFACKFALCSLVLKFAKERRVSPFLPR